MNYSLINLLIFLTLKYSVKKHFSLIITNLNKFEYNSKQGIFLGHPKNSSGYLNLDISTNSVITA